MELKYCQIDTFTDKLFGGNPAKVVQLEIWLEDELLQNIAKENSVDATAFFVIDGEDIELRWFTPDLELDLCGHATLATAHVLTEFGFDRKTIEFNTKCGKLYVHVENDLYVMNLPQRKPVKAELPNFIKDSLNKQPKEVLKSRDYILVYEKENDVRNIKIDKNIFDKENIDPGGVAITAKGNEVDFVSRFFIPQATIFEDPVTGSLHASLTPYWSETLNKKEMIAFQLSSRQGKLYCTNLKDRVLIAGKAKTYSEGVIKLATTM
ncbi:PhzF family phenazine biosynthesis protein [Aquimarina sp. 2201CG5-10]|uniref:PhzF family phenazine biosynthesis protein n=1 Tax=Aquimarina callyspongiae TaxID=3098150 RepID=UPI002AB402E8|nr:PhzF family phenazine biosynthesis protein [Aquimarina sp. 2201CG5-10]MDY8137477.1 PhzF family phenazine biosynthesis protein [Aquimarina sp. 2201CG5-10]